MSILIRGMYDELIKNLRHDSASALQNCEFDFVHDWMLKAADAIEELQKQLREEKVDNVNLTGWLAEEHAKLDKAEIESIKTKEEFAKYRGKHRWIPVRERLPEKYDRVLVYSKATRIGRGIDFINSDGNWFSTQKVSHWMPLPKPPKDGKT